MNVAKICSKCKIKKPINEFYTDKRAKDKAFSQCKKCIINQHKTPAGKKIKKNATNKYQKTLRGKESHRNNRLKAKYGITLEEYNKILKSQGGVCKVCGTGDPGGKYGIFHVDHNHKTGKIRGLLCNECNRGLGAFKDSIWSLIKAIWYLYGN
jgi:hypothetical protein